VEPADTFQSISPLASASACKAIRTASHVPSLQKRAWRFQTVSHGADRALGALENLEAHPGALRQQRRVTGAEWTNHHPNKFKQDQTKIKCYRHAVHKNDYQ
jgi:hypothetical protein